MDRNPMLQGLQNPMPNLGVISFKAMPDMNLIYQWQNQDVRTELGCYPGGKVTENHDIMPGDTAFGQVGVRNLEIGDGEPNELSIVSLAGLEWRGYCSQREMEDDFYWQGIVTTECRLTNPMDSTTSDPDHGFGGGRVGTFSVINNGWKTFHAGDYIAWQFPATPFHPKSAGGLDTASPPELFMGGQTVNMLARQGVPVGQFRPEYVPFDHTDFTVQLAGVFATFTNPKSEKGIQDMSFVAAAPNIHGYKNERPWSTIQDEGVGYKYSIWGIGLTLVETLLRKGLIQPGVGVAGPLNEQDAYNTAKDISRQIGLFSQDGTEQAIMMEGLADVFLNNISAGDDYRSSAVTRFRNASGQRQSTFSLVTDNLSDTDMYYARLRLNCLNLLTGAVGSSWFSKTRKIVGRALNDAAPADTLHGLFGHTTPT
jgi:hypothetical protein